MTKHQFDVSMSSLKQVHDMPGTWSDDDYRKLLAQLEVDGNEEIFGNDLVDLVLMALQELEPDAAADTILAYKLDAKITAGARANIVEDLMDGQRPWEEVSDIQLHASIFSAAVLLHKAFPSSLANPDMMCVILQVNAVTPEATKLLTAQPEAAFVARMLADALSEDSILERLFDEQLLSHNFPEAKGIIWGADFGDHLSAASTSAELTVYSSRHWLKAMASVSDFQSSAYNDRHPLESNHG